MNRTEQMNEVDGWLASLPQQERDAVAAVLVHRAGCGNRLAWTAYATRTIHLYPEWSELDADQRRRVLFHEVGHIIDSERVGLHSGPKWYAVSHLVVFPEAARYNDTTASEMSAELFAESYSMYRRGIRQHRRVEEFWNLHDQSL